MKLLQIAALAMLCLFCSNPAVSTMQEISEKNSNVGKGREILLKAVAAAGGLETFKQIDNFRIKTNSVIFQSQGQTPLTVTEVIQLPDKTKQTMALKQGKRVQVLNSDQSWKQVGNNISDLSEAEKREMRRGLFRETINIFRMTASDSLQVEYLDKETIGGQSSHILQIKNQSADFFRLYIDTATFLVTKKVYQGAPEVGLVTLEEKYSDYRTVDGIKIPFHTLVRANGRKFIESDVVEAKFNLPLEDDFFLKD
ncbi:outer membrane lipoprotein-sorting protein [candidate division KSB1 bacterium]|nr:outer membrane lipoprotein-sorting protein [candidate division KSB1 bacterium]NIR72350.1 outer membrane lipoprotein-sorting protein [candidate division KSB1 bacterium]NIS25056.1 outer membrane lipoprotein-sorting protein [candidate division KSB1 bacterium]NIT71977.1 outer membrane lipoprotein-sorting protein [candidate division KSB1 bacterium]NIU25733.1 outer membrane lipoprotein-sorting protein [candidate division KSB1 bacterium]